MKIGPYNSLKEYFRSLQCDGCKSGNPCNHTEEQIEKLMEEGKISAPAYIEKEDGTRQWFCCIACMLLQFPESTRKKIIEWQFNDAGHCEDIFLGG